MLIYRGEYHIASRNAYGSDLGNGTWSGLVGSLQRNETDFTCNDIMLTPSRMKVVDNLDVNLALRYLSQVSCMYIFDFI